MKSRIRSQTSSCRITKAGGSVMVAAVLCGTSLLAGTGCDKSGERADQPPPGHRSIAAPSPVPGAKAGVPSDAPAAAKPLPIDLKEAAQSVFQHGNGSLRFKELDQFMVAASPGQVLGFLLTNADQLTDDDVTALARSQDKILVQSMADNIKILNKSQSSGVHKLLLDYLNQQSLRLDPLDSLTQAESITDEGLRKTFVLDSMKSAMDGKPAKVIPLISRIFKTMSSGKNSMREEKPGQTQGAAAIFQIATHTSVNVKDEAWEAMTAIPDEAFRMTLAAGIFSGIVEQDELVASKWLNTLANGPEKSVAVTRLVGYLYSRKDGVSAKAWYDSAADYLTPIDRANIEGFKNEFEEHSKDVQSN